MASASRRVARPAGGPGQGSTRAEDDADDGQIAPQMPPFFGKPDELLEWISLACRRLAGNRASAAGAAGADACRMASGHVPPSTTPAPGQEEETRRPRSHSESTSHRRRRGWWCGRLFFWAPGLPLSDRGQHLPATASDILSVEPRRRRGQGGDKTRDIAGVLPSPRPAADAPTAPTREADQREHVDMPEMVRQDTGSQARHVFASTPTALEMRRGDCSTSRCPAGKALDAESLRSKWDRCPERSSRGCQLGRIIGARVDKAKRSRHLLPMVGEDAIERAIPRIGSPCLCPKAREWPSRVGYQISNVSNSSALCYPRKVWLVVSLLQVPSNWMRLWRSRPDETRRIWQSRLPARFLARGWSHLPRGGLGYSAHLMEIMT